MIFCINPSQFRRNKDNSKNIVNCYDLHRIKLPLAKSSTTLRSAVGVVALASLVLVGCTTQAPSGSAVMPRTLGSATDEINRQMEENADLAKMIVYCHEFETNATLNQSDLDQANFDKLTKGFEYVTPDQVRGFRLTPSGQDHLRAIANQLRHQIPQFENTYLQPRQQVIVERSQTSKRWNSLHRYPVNLNRELDEFRRRIVVNALTGLGVANADYLVVIAPAYPEGMSAQEASTAYGRTYLRNGF